ncbi:DUF4238 domain-containing protein [Marixanthomonas spongiae]|uniref:DUF4238 domain-containing protein n=1 Tax=Marixanthomonas spongiae TaxID=2174845 RepID=A0A2U0HWW7_9FLAO|nr:DUF4238 domain-containing protein [Marixanthomonas spongiae]PVW13337.1 hypothetical protein DDV96_13295 [Marixanthomonas spongiae]
MNQHVRNQHYVPQFLLKNFSSRGDKFIWAYDKNEKYNIHNQIKERAIRRVASEEFFYDQFKSSKIGSYEYALKEAEDAAAPIISNIINTKSIRDLSKKDRRRLSLFITLQYLRTKGQLLQTEYLTNTLSEQIKQKTNIQIEKVDSKKIWFLMLEQSIKFPEILMNKVWMLSESNNSFYISDNPVALQNSTDTSKVRGTLGLQSFGIEIYLPLSPSLTLCLFCEKLFKNSGYEKNFIENSTCAPENIKNLNSLQINYSQRFIFSHKKDFDLVKKQLKNTTHK